MDQIQGTWHSLPAEETAKTLGTDLERGLAPAEVVARQRRLGPNELIEREGPAFWQLLLDQFRQFLVIILIVAALISFFLGEWLDGVAILAIVILNAVIGVVQESKAEQALAALKKLAAPEARVIRDGHQATIPARDLVPGDLVLLETGNYVPADLRLVESVNLRIDEASLTGESVPVQKRADSTLPTDAPLGDRRNCAYMSTLITYGRGRGLVTGTGMNTEIGRIAEMIQSYDEEPTPLQVKLDQLGRWLGWGALAICAVVFLAGWLQGRDVLEMFMVAVSLAIAAVPEGLPAVVTICLALGLQRMLQRHALIRKLPAVETLGSATAICSDKTGTLTKNEMTAVQLYVDRTLLAIQGEGYMPQGGFHDDGRQVDLAGYPGSRLLLRAAALCSDAHLENGQEEGWFLVGDPTEGALVVAAAKAGLWQEELAQAYPRRQEIPFDSTRKRMTTIHPDPRHGGYVAYVKGAPDLLLELCHKVIEDGTERPLTGERRGDILSTNEALSSNALRVLGVAYRPLALDARRLGLAARRLVLAAAALSLAHRGGHHARAAEPTGVSRSTNCDNWSYVRPGGWWLAGELGVRPYLIGGPLFQHSRGGALVARLHPAPPGIDLWQTDLARPWTDVDRVPCLQVVGSAQPVAAVPGVVLCSVPSQEQYAGFGDAHPAEGRLFPGGRAAVSVWWRVRVGYPHNDRLLSGTMDRDGVYSSKWGGTMKTLVVYDSLYGNTKTIAQSIGDAIPGEVAVMHVGDVTASGLGAYDLLIIGAPTHGAKPSPDMQEFLEQIQAQALEGVKVAGFDTRMTNRLITLFGTAAPKIAKALKAKGGTSAGSAEGFYVTGGEGPLKDGEVERAAAWAQGLAENQG